MIGLDTNILVAHAIAEHPFHHKVREQLNQFLADQHRFALTSGILSEFIHIVTDAKRFETPLTMVEALEWAEYWSGAAEVTVISTDEAVNELWLRWLLEYRLGRKRLMDTLIAATWHAADVREMFTLNPADFKIFSVFAIHQV